MYYHGSLQKTKFGLSVRLLTSFNKVWLVIFYMAFKTMIVFGKLSSLNATNFATHTIVSYGVVKFPKTWHFVVFGASCSWLCTQGVSWISAQLLTSCWHLLPTAASVGHFYRSISVLLFVCRRTGLTLPNNTRSDITLADFTCLISFLFRDWSCKVMGYRLECFVLALLWDTSAMHFFPGGQGWSLY